jgi:hypothetical protein
MKVNVARFASYPGVPCLPHVEDLQANEISEENRRARFNFSLDAEDLVMLDEHAGIGNGR